MTERSPINQKKIFDADLTLSRMFAGRITPSQAVREFKAGFERLGLDTDTAWERIRNQDQAFQEGNWEIAQGPMVDWDHVKVILERDWGIPEEQRLTRWVPVGTESSDPDFRDLAF